MGRFVVSVLGQLPAHLTSSVLQTRIETNTHQNQYSNPTLRPGFESRMILALRCSCGLKRPTSDSCWRYNCSKTSKVWLRRLTPVILECIRPQEPHSNQPVTQHAWSSVSVLGKITARLTCSVLQTRIETNTHQSESVLALSRRLESCMILALCCSCGFIHPWVTAPRVVSVRALEMGRWKMSDWEDWHQSV